MGKKKIVITDAMITDEIICNAGHTVGEIKTWYPPNVIKIIDNTVWCYSGLEEGLMCWDPIPRRQLVKEIKKRMKLGLKI